MKGFFKAREKRIDLRHAFVVAVIIIFFISLTYIINFYSGVKQKIIKEIGDENIKIHRAIRRDIERAQRLIDSIINQVGNTNDEAHINKVLNATLKGSVANGNLHNTHPLRCYSWINSKFTKIGGYSIMEDPNAFERKKTGFVKDIIESTPREKWDRKLIFHSRKKPQHNDSLEIIYSISDPHSKKYLASVVLSYDLALMIRKINLDKKREYTNFALVRDKTELLFSSRKSAQNLVSGKEVMIPRDLKEKVFFGTQNTSVLYLAMFKGGINYFKSNIPLGNEYVTLITSLDNKYVIGTFYKTIISKVLEVAGIAVFFIILLIILLRRESTLRLKSQRAEIIAKNGNRAKGDFLRFVAHEMRTPLSYITNTSAIIMDEISDPSKTKAKKYLAGIKQNADIITGLIRDILDEQQILSGKFTIKRKKTDIRNLLENAVRINQMKFLGGKNCKIILNIEYEGKMQKILCDHKRILQVLNNLIGNAVQYSYEGGIVRVFLRKQNDYLVIIVQDQGIGISREDLERIFSYKYCAEPMEDRALAGESHGIGIYIVKQILDAHKAEFKIESTLYRGTKAIIKFPIIKDKSS